MCDTLLLQYYWRAPQVLNEVGPLGSPALDRFLVGRVARRKCSIRTYPCQPFVRGQLPRACTNLLQRYPACRILWANLWCSQRDTAVVFYVPLPCLRVMAVLSINLLKMTSTGWNPTPTCQIDLLVGAATHRTMISICDTLPIHQST